MYSAPFLQVRQKFVKRSSFLTLVFLSTILLCGFQQSEKFDPTPINKERAEKFLKHLMVENIGIYTLVGSKPMTSFSVVPVIDITEKKLIYDSKTAQFKQHISFEKFKLTKADCNKLWEDWREVEDQYLGRQFRIVENDKTGGGIFINIPATTLVFDKWHEDFARITGLTFDPIEAAYCIGDESSRFWQKVQGNHYLLGLLLGFGEQNAKLFQWEEEKKMHYPLRRGTSILPGHTGKAAHELDIQDLDVPGFIVYQVIDEQLEKYKIEREKCIELYKGRDFFELTTQLLKGIPPKAEVRELSDESKLLIKEWVGYNSTIR